jgi:hypothetical protein
MPTETMLLFHSRGVRLVFLLLLVSRRATPLPLNSNSFKTSSDNARRETSVGGITRVYCTGSALQAVQQGIQDARNMVSYFSHAI